MNSKICENCKVEFVSKEKSSKYCSHRCSAIVSNTNRARLKVCEQCKEKLKSHQKRFCSKTCAGIFGKNKRVNDWLSTGDHKKRKSNQLPSWIRNFLIDEAKNQCPKCGWAEKNVVTNTVILTINHIDGNWKNNKRENLEVLCYNCHTLTPTFGSLNKGSESGRRFYASMG